jgi:aryl-alcohol dehydrogenase-like predicted oxidoreductase
MKLREPGKTGEVLSGVGLGCDKVFIATKFGFQWCKDGTNNFYGSA